MAQTLAHSTSRRHVVLADTLASAAKLGHVVAAEGALAELPDVNTPVRGYTALGWAAVYGHANVAYRILAHKTADVNLRSGPDDAWTPLMLAVCEGHGDVVDLLVVPGDRPESYGVPWRISALLCSFEKSFRDFTSALQRLTG